ncbi:acyltransferase [Desulfovibrio sp. OttesenSCG-928-C06]|nr:acyltransferase [Desulfovibrio sp. OttesenSCG-928-C06]
MQKRINSLQLLRAVAAVMVVLLHSQYRAFHYQGVLGLPVSFLNSTPEVRSFGASGVDIFFVISGVVMAYVTNRKSGVFSHIPVFLAKRFARIYPVYWFYLTICIVFLLLRPEWFFNWAFELRGAVYSYFLIPYTPEVKLAPLLHVGWTLWYEVYFYLLVAAGLLLRRNVFLVLLGAYFAACCLSADWLRAFGAFGSLASNPILFEFYAGFLLGVLYVSGKKIPTGVALLMLASGIALYVIWIAGVVKFPLGIAAIFLVGGVLFIEKNKGMRLPSWVMSLGDSSYTLYLSHMFVIGGVSKLLYLSGLAGQMSADFFIVVLVAASVIAAHVLYLTVEKPMNSFLKRKIGKKFSQAYLR